MNHQAQRRSTGKHLLLAMVIMLLTLGAFLVQNRAVDIELASDDLLATFDRRRGAMEMRLHALMHAPISEARDRNVLQAWRAMYGEAKALVAVFGAPSVEAHFASGETALQELLNSRLRDDPQSASIATVLTALSNVSTELRGAANARERRQLDRHRILMVVTLGVLAAQACWLLFPSLRQLARVETKVQRAEDRLTFLAHHDELTGLANRRALEQRLAQLVAERDARFGLVLCDLDGFKPINDVFGHDAGDTVLRAVGKRLEHGLRPGDLAVRLGGDEFVLVVSEAATMEELNGVAERLTARLADPVRFGPHKLRFAASVGTAIFPDHGATPHALLNAADAAMYEAKQAGGKTVRSYSNRLRARDQQRAEIVHALEAALAADGLSVMLQPRREVATGTVKGFEALTRWRRETDGEVPPSVFIPIAENAGLLTPLTLWLLDEVARTAALWDRQRLPAVPFSINIASSSLMRDEIMDALLAASGAVGGAGRLGIEIAEDAMLGRNAEPINERLQVLRTAGVIVDIDDFGTGYASLSHLARMPFDHLKIAGNFVSRLDESASAATVVRTVIELAQRLGGRAVATCVETQAQLDFLADHRCDEVQGYLIAPPLSIDHAASYLSVHHVVSQAG